MEIRRARPEDGPGIGIVHVRSWQTTYVGIVPDEHLERLNAEKRGAWWSSQLAALPEGQTVWVAVDENRSIVGFASGGPPQEPEEGYTCELYAIYLLQSTQGQGTGRQLVQRVARDLFDAGHRRMLVGVLSENPACRFYERLGAKFVREFQIERGGKVLSERFYGWDDLSLLLA